MSFALAGHFDFFAPNLLIFMGVEGNRGRGGGYVAFYVKSRRVSRLPDLSRVRAVAWLAHGASMHDCAGTESNSLQTIGPLPSMGWSTAGLRCPADELVSLRQAGKSGNYHLIAALSSQQPDTQSSNQGVGSANLRLRLNQPSEYYRGAGGDSHPHRLYHCSNNQRSSPSRKVQDALVCGRWCSFGVHPADRHPNKAP